MILLSSFVFGLIFGSFLNVVIYRLKTPPGRGLSVSLWKDRSHCPQCQTQLQWFDLIPLLSFLFLRGNCRYCDEKISWQYPAVELLSGFLWLAVFYKNELNGNFQFFPLGGIPHSGTILSFIYYIFIFSALLIIAVYDFKWKIIPDKIIYPAIIVALIYNFFSLIRGGFGGFLIHLFTATASFLFFFLIFYFSKGRAMGLGDAKLAFLIGLFLSPWLTFVAFTLAFIIGAVFGIILIILGKKTLKSQIAFGPFLILGTAIAFFFSNFINKI